MTAVVPLPWRVRDGGRGGELRQDDPRSPRRWGSKHRPRGVSWSTENPSWTPVPTGPWYSRSTSCSRGCPSGRTPRSDCSRRRSRTPTDRPRSRDAGTARAGEPFGSVDAQTRRHLGAELLSIWRELDKTLLFVTHDIEEAVTLADRVFVLSGTPGRVREDARIDLSRVRGRTGDEFVDCVDRLLDIAEPSR